jgi:hypothetical protein
MLMVVQLHIDINVCIDIDICRLQPSSGSSFDLAHRCLLGQTGTEQCTTPTRGMFGCNPVSAPVSG